MREWINYLRYQQKLGIKEVFLPCSIDKFMELTKRKPRKIGDAVRDGESFLHSPSRTASPLPNALPALEKMVSTCVKCKLSQGRTQTVFGTGNTKADIMFVGEGPGRDEDLQGKPFVGRAGQLLTKIIQAMGFERSDVYIANIVKCRPPNNRGPLPDEVESCTPYLLKQIELIKPKIIVALGSYAARFLLKTETPISKLRGEFFDFHGAKLLPTFHPAFLLRNPNMKRPVWEDMQKVIKYCKDLKEKK
ncbi:MAG TPA: uracil-DNA glycosylase [Bdellovibrionota bacterium]|nr:uracil-DNA glycosylase [Bdellovibrionota bacterium]